MAKTLSRVDARLNDEATMLRIPAQAQVTMRRLIGCLMLTIAMFSTSTYAAFDQSHAKLTELLEAHVVWVDQGTASRVDYGAIKSDPSLLTQYLSEVSAVTRQQYNEFSKAQQLAFLINAYNAYTIQFILTKYPDLKSIKDLGSLFSNPWKKRLFPLLGEKRSLDEIEHGMIRRRGVFDDPRIHMAVNCASIGCPALRDEAYVADRLDMQLDDAVRRFLSDRSRNRADGSGLWVSKIFDWYAEDFDQQSGSVQAWLARYADLLSDEANVRADVRAASLRLHYLDYDWSLNDLRK